MLTPSQPQTMPSMLPPGEVTVQRDPPGSTGDQPFTRESAVRGVIEAVTAEGRRLDQLRQEFPQIWHAVMALKGIDMMRPVKR